MAYSDVMKKHYTDIISIFENTEEDNIISPKLIRQTVSKRDPAMHKGSAGSLMICAGSVGMTGAAIMSASSALRCGCGLITLGCAKELNTIFEIRLTEQMTLPLPSDDGIISPEAADTVIRKANTSNALLIGPGLSASSGVTELIYKVLTSVNVPVVADADALNAIAKNIDILSCVKSPLVLTPHPGEFARLCDTDTETAVINSEFLAKEMCAKYNIILVLKSHKTIVVTPEGKIYRNILGNPGMAVGGSGDVLAGCIASFLAQDRGTEYSALAGVFFHSLAADMAAMELGQYSLTPTDIINHIPYAIKETSGQ